MDFKENISYKNILLQRRSARDSFLYGWEKSRAINSLSRERRKEGKEGREETERSSLDLLH